MLSQWVVETVEDLEQDPVALSGLRGQGQQGPSSVQELRLEKIAHLTSWTHSAFAVTLAWVQSTVDDFEETFAEVVPLRRVLVIST